MPLGENRNTNLCGVYNLEFVVHIVAFGFFSPPAVYRFHRCSILMSSGTGAVGPTEAAVPRDLFLLHSATSYLSLVFCPSFLKYLGTWLRHRVQLGFDSRQELRFLSSHPSRLSWGLADTPVLWEYRTFSGVKRSEHGANHSPASSESREEKCVDLRLKFTHTSPLCGLSKKLCIFTCTSRALDWCGAATYRSVFVTSTGGW
jgi:hypothetical protein